jgi:hypothetical protein
LSQQLSAEYGKGFSPQSLWNFRQFYLEFPILSATRRELRWTHYKTLIRITGPIAREWYANEAASQGWSTRALDRQVSRLFYERLLSSQDQAAVCAERSRSIDSTASTQLLTLLCL